MATVRQPNCSTEGVYVLNPSGERYYSGRVPEGHLGNGRIEEQRKIHRLTG